MPRGYDPTTRILVARVFLSSLLSSPPPIHPFFPPVTPVNSLTYLSTAFLALLARSRVFAPILFHFPLLQSLAAPRGGQLPVPGYKGRVTLFAGAWPESSTLSRIGVISPGILSPPLFPSLFLRRIYLTLQRILPFFQPSIDWIKSSRSYPIRFYEY